MIPSTKHLKLLRKDGCQKGARGAPDVNWNKELCMLGLNEVQLAFNNASYAVMSSGRKAKVELQKLSDDTRSKIKGMCRSFL